MLQLGHRTGRRGDVTRGEQSFATCDEQVGDLVVTVGQLVVDLIQRVQGMVVEVGAPS